MTWADLPVVEALERELFPIDMWSVETFWSELANVPATRCYLVAVDAAEDVIGYCGVMTVADDADVQTVAVAPAGQGRGVGRLLLHSMMRIATDRGCTTLFLEVRSDNTPALTLYQRQGFEITGRRRDYYGSGIDALTMRLRLDDRREQEVGEGHE